MGNKVGHPAVRVPPVVGNVVMIQPQNRAPVPVNPPQQMIINPIPDFRPPRYFVYSRAQKERAVYLLNMGITCRQVARMIGPRCSPANPIRWRQQARRQARLEAQLYRRRLENMMRQKSARC